MATVTASNAKARFGELLDRVARGEEIIITRHNKPVARIVPEGRRSLEDVREGVAGLRELQQEISSSFGKGKLTWRHFKSFLAEGRK